MLQIPVKQAASTLDKLLKQVAKGQDVVYANLYGANLGKQAESLVRALDAAVASGLVIQYGGSMKASNAVELLSQPDIDGGLIGGASLNAEEFLAICRAG